MWSGTSSEDPSAQWLGSLRAHQEMVSHQDPWSVMAGPSALAKLLCQPQYWLGNLFCGFLLIFLTEGWAWLSPLTGVRGRNAATYPGLLGARQCAQCGAYMLADHVPGATAGKALLTPVYTRSRPEGQ